MAGATEINVDIAIVGYGPGGAVLASLLGQRGHKVAVLEKFATPYNLPRMSTLDGKIARVLQHMADPDEALKDSLAQPAAYMYGADGQLNQRLDWSKTLCGHPERLSLHQPNIEAAMHARVDSCPSVQVHWGTQATAIQDIGDHVIVTATKQSGGDLKVRARYVVGMDGGSSFVREAVGIRMDVLKQHDDEWLLTDFDILDPAVKPPATEVHLDAPRPYYWGPNGAGRCRIDMKLLPDDGPEVRTHADAFAFLEDKAGIPQKAVRITRQVVYRFSSAIAERMRVGNVFLGGDAAHLMTPGMAQGSCSAMRDGINLAWRLDLVLTSRADPAILDSYGPERLGHVTPFVQGSLMAWQLTQETDPARAATRDAFGFLQRTDDGNLVQLAGTLSPQGRARIDGREGLLDSLVGFGFQLVSRVPVENVLSSAQKELLQKLGAHTVVLGPESVEDLDGTYRNYLEEHGLVAYLSRPDLYVFGIAVTADDVPSLVDSLAKELTEPTPEKATAAANDSVALPGAGFVHKTITTGEFTVHYAEAGPSSPEGTIVSFPGSAGLEMSTAKDELAKRYRAVEVNPPGWGDQADQLVDGPFVLLATSMGGANALYLTAQIPERVRGIILEGSMAPCRPQDLYPLSTTQPPIHPKKPWATAGYVAHQMANRMRMVQTTKPDMQATSAIATVRQRAVPVLALLGSEDEVMKPSQKDSFHAVLPNEEFNIITGGRHDLQNTTPDEFVARVESFIKNRL
ncbi:hypothetical protein BJY00DRAFT_310656 [Aspergillus carlsbadensis]|nr:hypothetical protein BJY00DRAFT_310656 [Aspergillus carlsbadensis]